MIKLDRINDTSHHIFNIQILKMYEKLIELDRFSNLEYDAFVKGFYTSYIDRCKEIKETSSPTQFLNFISDILDVYINNSKDTQYIRSYAISVMIKVENAQYFLDSVKQYHNR